jgi:hypothetical protein
VVTWWVSIVATGKWLGGGFLVRAIFVDDDLRRALGVGIARLARAIKTQRMSFMVVALFGTLSIVPPPNI